MGPRPCTSSWWLIATAQPKCSQMRARSLCLVPPTQLPLRGSSSPFAKHVLRKASTSAADFSRMPAHLAAAYRPQIGCLPGARAFLSRRRPFCCLLGIAGMSACCQFIVLPSKHVVFWSFLCKV